MFSFIDKFKWAGTDRIYGLPWLRNRIEYTADPSRVKEFVQGCKYTRSQLTRDTLTRFHISNNSIVVSDDEHAQFLRKIFITCLPQQEKFPSIAKELIDNVLPSNGTQAAEQPIHLSGTLIRQMYLSLLVNLLGVSILSPLKEYINSIDFKPSTRPMHLDALMYAFGMQLPGFGPMRGVINWVYFKDDHYTRKIATKLEEAVYEFSQPKQDSWYSALLEMKQSGKLTRAEFRGELTSTLVSSYALSAALSTMLLCLAGRPEYVNKIREDKRMAKCFVDEVLRLYPPFRQFGYEEKGIWQKSRKSRGEVTDLMVSIFALHRNDAVWEDPDSFIPERFLVSGLAKGCKFMPFGMGKRSCPGGQYSTRLLVETLRYVCSQQCNLKLALPADYDADESGMPIGVNGRLISFPVDDRIFVQRKSVIEKLS